MRLRTVLRSIGVFILAVEVGLIAWQWHQRGVIGGAIAAAQARDRARAALGRRAADLEGALRHSAARTSQAVPAAGRPTPGSFADRFGTALRDPLFLKQLAPVQDRMIADHYGPLIERLQLTPAQRERFTALLAEKQLAKTDAEAEANPMIGTGLMIPAIAAAQQEVNAQIQQELGPAAYQAYYDFEMTDGLRATVQRLQDSLRYSGTPLANAQAEALVTAFDQLTPEAERGGIAKFTGASVEVATGLVSQQFSTPLPDRAPEAAQALLSAPQLAQLRRLMRQQDDELQLRSRTLAALHAAQPSP
jgi:hypothetical protein